MSRVHSKNTVIMVDGVDISAHCNTSEYDRTAGSHQTTGYGMDDHTFAGGIRTNKLTLGGQYDSSETDGPRRVLHDRVGDTVPVIRRVEGTGSGLPEDEFDAVIVNYKESAPVDDYVQWSAELQISGGVTTTAQA